MINGLVMDHARKATLMALAKSFGRRNKLDQEMTKGVWAADFVRGKGSGLIFLLHGRPGVGKTCTAGKFILQHQLTFAQAVSPSLTPVDRMHCRLHKTTPHGDHLERYRNQA